MACLRLKMIGYQNNSEYDLIINKEEGQELTLKYIYLYFMKKGVHIETLKQLKYICRGNSLTQLEKIITDSEEVTMFIFTNKVDIKNDIVRKIFTMIPESEIKEEQAPSYNNDVTSFKMSTKNSTEIKNLPIEDDTEELFEPSADEINKINEKIFHQFQDKDFLNLIRICITKPELLKIANSYLVNGSIIDKINFDDIKLDDFSYESEFEYIRNFFVTNLSRNLSEFHFEVIKKVLVHFNGHLNLSLRYLINLNEEDRSENPDISTISLREEFL